MEGHVAVTCRHLSNNIEPSVYGSDAPYGKLLWPLVIFEHAHLHRRTDSQAFRTEYCIVGIPHNTAIGWLVSRVAKALDLQLAGCELIPGPALSSNNLGQSCLHPRASAGHSGLAMAWLTAVWEAAASCVYHDSHCDVQPWARAAHPSCSA